MGPEKPWPSLREHLWSALCADALSRSVRATWTVYSNMCLLFPGSGRILSPTWMFQGLPFLIQKPCW